MQMNQGQEMDYQSMSDQQNFAEAEQLNPYMMGAPSQLAQMPPLLGDQGMNMMDNQAMLGSAGLQVGGNPSIFGGQ